MQWFNIYSDRKITSRIDTTARLNKHVVPRNGTTQVQALGDEVEFLLQGKVGIDTSSSSLFCDEMTGMLLRQTVDTTTNLPTGLNSPAMMPPLAR